MIGVIKNVGEVQNTYSSRTEKEFQKRGITIVDKSLNETILTLWESEAVDFQAVEKDVIAIKGAKVSDFGGVTLGSTHSSVIQINPDIPEGHALREWYESVGSAMTTTSLTHLNPNGGMMETKSMTFGEMKNVDFSNGEPKYYTNMAWVTSFSSGRHINIFKILFYDSINAHFSQIKLCTRDVQLQSM